MFFKGGVDFFCGWMCFMGIEITHDFESLGRYFYGVLFEELYILIQMISP